MSSPEKYLLRATVTARKWHSEMRVLPEAVVPVDDEGWFRSLEEASLTRLPDLLDGSNHRVQSAARSGDFQTIRNAALSIVSDFDPVLEDVWCLAALRPSATCGVHALQSALTRVLGFLLDRLDGMPTPDLQFSIAAVGLAVVEVNLGRNTDGNDVWKTSLQLDSGVLKDARGVTTASRLLAAFHGRDVELQRLANVTLSPVSSYALDISKVGVALHCVIDSPSPLQTLRSAVAVKELILRKFQTEPEHVAETLNALTERLDRSFSSHQGMLRIMSNLANYETASERAFLKLDLYRRMVEGQLRPWGWVVLRLLGRGSVKMAEIGVLSKQLEASGNRLAMDISGRMLPSVRNAAAHEDYSWDSQTSQLTVGTSTVRVESLTSETDACYALMCGAELGWMLARAESAEFDMFLDHAQRGKRPSVLGHIAARDYFGTNGLAISRWIDGDGVLSIELESMNKQQVNPCIQATMWAAQHLPAIQTFRVFVKGRASAALDLDRTILDGLLPLWMPAQRWFTKMPVSVFVPALSVARLAQKSEGDTAKAAVWFVSNEAVHAFLDLQETVGSTREHLISLGRSLGLAAEALKVTASYLPTAAAYLLGTPYRRLRAAARWAMSEMAVADPGQSDYFEKQIRTLHDHLAVPEVLPGFGLPD